MEDRKITRDTLIDDLELSVRLHHCLINDWDYPRNAKRPATVGDFIDVPDHELMRIPNFGRKSLVEWREIVWAVENPDNPAKEEQMAEYKALKNIRATINQIAATHRALATHYNKLTDIIAPLG